jgi:hypothetical protein
MIEGIGGLASLHRWANGAVLDAPQQRMCSLARMLWIVSLA